MYLTLLLATLVITIVLLVLIKNRRVIETLAVFSGAVMLVYSFLIALTVAEVGVYSFSFFLSVDALGAIIILIIGTMGFATAIYSVAYFNQETKKGIVGRTRVKQYFVLLYVFLTAMYLATTASSPIFAWISIEATTLSTAFLISFYNKPSAIEGAWKYLIINSVGLLLGFFGTMLYFTAVPSTLNGGFIGWDDLLANANQLDPLMAKIAFIFVLIGYGTKVGLTPMHTWKPDAYSKAPAPLGALLAGALLPVAFFVILKFERVTDAVVGPEFTHQLFLVFGILSIIVASLIMFNAKNYKRLLAYSSIENAGIIALGFSFGGLGVLGAVLHMIYHSGVKAVMFFSAGNLLLTYGSDKIDRIKNALRVIPVTSMLFILGFLIVTGTPPFGIFFSKVYILSAGIASHPYVTFFAIFFMTLVFIGFLKHVTAMFLSDSEESDLVHGEKSIWLVIPPIFFVILIVGLSFTIPPFLQTLIDAVVANY